MFLIYLGRHVVGHAAPCFCFRLPVVCQAGEPDFLLVDLRLAGKIDPRRNVLNAVVDCLFVKANRPEKINHAGNFRWIHAHFVAHVLSTSYQVNLPLRAGVGR